MFASGFWQNVTTIRENMVDSVTGFLLIFLLTIISVYLLRQRRSNYKKLPPGPWGCPVVGHLPFLGKNRVEKLSQYRKEYGDIFSIQMGSYPAVVLNGTGVIRKALSGHMEAFAGRPKLYTINLIGKMVGETGLTFSEYGPHWKAHRRISNNALRMFASYRTNPVEEIILGESQRLIEHFSNQSERPFDPRNETALVAGSIIYQILFGRQDNIREDETYCKMVKNIKDFTDFANAGNPVDIMPWIRFLFRGRLRRFLEIIRTSLEVQSTQQKRHAETFDPAHIRDVTDALFQASKEITPEERGLGLTSEKVNTVIGDFLGAGSDTVGTTLLWSFLHMVTSPHVQARVHSEIDHHIGRSRWPTYKDRKSLPFVEATILEIFRFGTIAPLAIPHATTCDVQLNGYSIPKDTFVLVNLASTCNDYDVWGDPKSFRPDRFLSNGSIDSSKAEMVLSFGVGRRRCLGEFIAKVELFMFFCSVMQNCSFHRAPGEVYTYEASFGLTMKPKPFKLIVKSRSN
ncbi:cytochrome P450 1A1-like [Liolophura sinensis]|uniref:cytochrome P450 1A1-like n=1 Tax=Liolophura sinensis TaxID=3198878 RepID=UPI00315973B3